MSNFLTLSRTTLYLLSTVTKTSLYNTCYFSMVFLGIGAKIDSNAASVLGFHGRLLTSSWPLLWFVVYENEERSKQSIIHVEHMSRPGGL